MALIGTTPKTPMSTAAKPTPRPRTAHPDPRRVLFAFLVATGESNRSAAGRVGVSLRTAKRWRKAPGFWANVDAIQKRHLEAAQAACLGHLTAAIDALAETMNADASDRWGDIRRLQAARAILDRLTPLERSAHTDTG